MGGVRKSGGALVGAIEAGGTKFVCAVGTGPGDLSRATFATGNSPAHVLSEVTAWLRAEAARRGPLHALGIGSFGPVDLDERSPTYGFITTTPKPGWSDTDLAGAFREAFPHLPVAFDTDVNAAALGEREWGAARGLDDFVYVTLGTGIGAGGMSGGRLLHGLVHPEMGHMLLPRAPGDDFAGICPFHGPCWEGLCCGPAIFARTGSRAETLPAGHGAWTLQAYYVACALANVVCVLSPRRIVVGGSVRKAGGLGQGRFFAMVRARLGALLNGYVASPALGTEIDAFVVPPALGDDAGVCGALALARTRC